MKSYVQLKFRVCKVFKTICYEDAAKLGVLYPANNFSKTTKMIVKFHAFFSETGKCY